MSTQELFRSEAVEHHASALGRDGRVLRLYPAWTAWAYGLLLVVAVTALAAIVFVRLNQYAVGSAVVRVDDRSVLTATRNGSISAVAATPGQRVAAGDVLARIDDTLERADQAGNLREIELQSRAVLLDPTNESARQALARLQAQRKLLEAELEACILRAPQAGVVNDVRVRVGQHLAPGEIICTLTREDAGFHVVALLPGHSRPHLRPGGPIRLELGGYRYFYQKLTIESVSDEVVGPVEARRYLGADVSDSIRLDGSVVVVRARLPSATFEVEGRTYRYFDGMAASAEAPVRSERILHTLIPGLRNLWGGWDE